MQQQLEPQTEILQFRQKYLKKHPGLEPYLRRTKVICLALVLLVAAHKLSMLFAVGDGLTIPGLIGAAMGTCIPAIFALAAYSGKWQCGFLFLLLGGYLTYDLIRFAVTLLPRILEGSLVLAGSPLWFCCLAITESACMAAAFVAAVWLTVPKKHRELAETARQMNVECGRIAREAAERAKL